MKTKVIYNPISTEKDYGGILKEYVAPEPNSLKWEELEDQFGNQVVDIIFNREAGWSGKLLKAITKFRIKLLSQQKEEFKKMVSDLQITEAPPFQTSDEIRDKAALMQILYDRHIKPAIINKLDSTKG